MSRLFLSLRSKPPEHLLFKNNLFVRLMHAARMLWPGRFLINPMASLQIDFRLLSLANSSALH